MLLLLALLFLSALIFWNFVWKRRGLPPGPVPLPLLGNGISLGRSKCHYAPFQQWSREFGPIYTIWLGEAPVVVVTDFELMRDLFVKDGNAYAGRHFMVKLMAEFTACRGTLYGVVNTEGELWKETRRFALQSMRNLGMGRARLEERFLRDIDVMIGTVRKEIASLEESGEKENGIELDFYTNRLIGSTINQVLFGHAFSDDHLEDFHRLKHAMDNQIKLLDTVTGRALIGNPRLRCFPPFSWTFGSMDNNATTIFAYIDKTIAARVEERERDRKAGRVEPGEANDLLNCFLDQVEAKAEPKEERDKYFNMENVRKVCFDLFFAGQETTSTTLNFLVLYLLLDQRVQSKMLAELDRLDTEKERAVVNECQRLCNLLPFNLTHRTMADVQIEGKDGQIRLSQGTNIVPQISCVLFDEKIFPNPRRFLPERFLNQSGQLERVDEFIPFGLGKRICMGESLARMELFLFTANFFRNFQVLPVDALNPPTAQKQKCFAPAKCTTNTFMAAWNLRNEHSENIHVLVPEYV
uniref:Cytochrome P450 n=1 Tax=Globodera rostochiensis TaxID=31243 RepID=A0A914I341_GLORO